MYQGQPPGYDGTYGPPPPGMFGMGMQGMGVGNGSFAQQQQAQAGAGMMFAGSAVSAMASMPGYALGAASLVGTAAPFLHAGLNAGADAGYLSRGAMAMGRGAITLADQVDPTTHLFGFMSRGARVGAGLGNAVSSPLARMAPNGVSMFSRPAAGRFAPMVGRGLGALGVEGMGGLTGMGIAGGVAGGLMAAAVPIAASVAISEGVQYVGDQLHQGASNTMRGQSLMNQIGRSVAPGQSMKGQGAETGRMMADMARGLGTDMEGIEQYAKELDSQKMFQTTRGAKEFRSKFTEVMKAVKEISKITQSTVDDAMKTFSELRAQGFYTTADIKAQSVTREAREQATGISSAVYNAVGSAGAQMARQYGLKGRVGSESAQRNVAGIALGLRSGSLSEEQVMEQGGAENLGLTLAQSQMRFLKSSTGRAMMGYAMGSGNGPDAERMRRMGAGTSLEDIVTGASGRGLGVMSATGSKEAQEKFAELAPAMMVTSALAKMKQLGTDVTEKNLVGMLARETGSRESAQATLALVQGSLKQRSEEQRGAESLGARAAHERAYASTGIMARASNALDTNVGEGLRASSNAAYGAFESAYATVGEQLFGGRAYTGGDRRSGQAFLKAHGGVDLGAGSSLRSGGQRLALNQERGSVFGVATASDRIADQYKEYMMAPSGLGADAGRRRQAIERGDVKDLGDGVMGSRHIKTADLARAEAATKRGLSAGLDEDQSARLTHAVGKGDYLEELEAARHEAGFTPFNSDYDPSLGGFLSGGFNKLFRAVNGAGAADDDFGNFFAAQKAGLVKSREEWLGLSKEKRTEMRAQVSRGMDSVAGAAGGDQAKRIRASVGATPEGDLSTVSDLQKERDSFEGSMSKYLHGGQGGISGALGWLTGSGGTADLAKSLGSSGKSREAYSEYMQALNVKDRKNMTPEEVKRINAAREALKASGISDGAYQSALSAERTLDDPEAQKRHAEMWRSADAAKGDAGGTLVVEFGRRAAVDIEAEDRERLSQRMGKLRSGDIKDEGLRASIDGVRGSLGGSRGDRMSAIKAAYAQALNSSEGGQTLSSEERRTFESAFGAQGAGVLDLGGKIKDGRLSKEEAAQLAKDGIDVEKIRKMDPKDQGKAIADALSAYEMGPGAEAGDEGPTSMEGVQTKYIEANAQFVSAVAAVLSQLKGKGIITAEGDVKESGWLPTWATGEG